MLMISSGIRLQAWVMRNLWDVTTLPHDNNSVDYGMKSGIGKGVVRAPREASVTRNKEAHNEGVIGSGFERNIT